MRLPSLVSKTLNTNYFTKMEIHSAFYFSHQTYFEHLSKSNLRAVCIFSLQDLTKKHGAVGSLAKKELPAVTDQ